MTDPREVLAQASVVALVDWPRTDVPRTLNSLLIGQLVGSGRTEDQIVSVVPHRQGAPATQGDV